MLVGLLGSGIQLSRTPAMHEAAARAHGIPYVYRLLDTDLMREPRPTLADLLRFAECFGFAGLNITYPYKQEILPLLDELSPAASEVGSVNTVLFRNGHRIGHNTDVWGFARASVVVWARRPAAGSCCSGPAVPGQPLRMRYSNAKLVAC